MVAVVLSGMVTAQQAALVNGFDGFENWTAAEVGELPSGWDGFNKNVQFGGMTVGTVECIEKSTVDPYEGTSSAKLTSTSIMGGPAAPGILTVGDFVVDWNAQDGDVVGGVAYSQLPIQLFGQFKYAPSGIDTGFVSIWFMENGTEVGNGYFEFTATTGGWTAFTVDIDYNVGATPDSMNVMFSSSNSTSSVPAGSVLEIDAIGFEAFLGMETIENSNLNCYPNPTSEKITVDFEQSTSGTIEIMNSIGEVVKRESFSGEEVTLETASLPKGVYQLRLDDGSRIRTESIVIY